MNSFFKSIGYASQGIAEACSERNFRIQVVIGAAAIVGAIALHLPLLRVAIIVLCCAIVLGAEAINSAVERLSDFVSPSHHDDIRKIKDLMAAAVLLISGGAFLVGVLIFGRALFF